MTLRGELLQSEREPQDPRAFFKVLIGRCADMEEPHFLSLADTHTHTHVLVELTFPVIKSFTIRFIKSSVGLELD